MAEVRQLAKGHIHAIRLPPAPCTFAPSDGMHMYKPPSRQSTCRSVPRLEPPSARSGMGNDFTARSRLVESGRASFEQPPRTASRERTPAGAQTVTVPLSEVAFGAMSRIQNFMDQNGLRTIDLQRDKRTHIIQQTQENKHNTGRGGWAQARPDDVSISWGDFLGGLRLAGLALAPHEQDALLRFMETQTTHQNDKVSMGTIVDPVMWTYQLKVLRRMKKARRMLHNADEMDPMAAAASAVRQGLAVVQSSRFPLRKKPDKPVDKAFLAGRGGQGREW
jgi:hypothetical protein